MIKKETVFVLGAGASMPYGLPSGNDLIKNIVRNYSVGQVSHRRLLKNLSFDEQEIDDFINSLHFSRNTSIDSFLQKRKEFLPIGKVTIAQQILEREDLTKLYDSKSDWYSYLLERMDAPSLEEFIQNKVKFLTFNYDRSLELYLFNFIKNSYGVTTDAALMALRSFEIIHLHGSLGGLMWEDGLSYGVDLGRRDDIKRAADNIKIIHEDVKDNFKEAVTIIKQAEIIYIMGFGFHPLNIERLELDKITPGGRYIYATGFNYTTHEIDEITARLGILFPIVPFDCIGLLRERGILR